MTLGVKEFLAQKSFTGLVGFTGHEKGNFLIFIYRAVGLNGWLVTCAYILLVGRRFMSLFLKEQAGKVKHLLSECMCEWRILCGDGIFFDMFVAAA